MTMCVLEESEAYTQVKKEIFGHRGVGQQFGKCYCRICINRAVFRDGLRCLMGHFRL